MKEDFFNDALENNAVVVQPNEGETFTMNGISFTFKITSKVSNDQLGVYNIVLAPRAIGAKLHYHRFMDETFIVNKGILTIITGTDNTAHKVGPGTVIYAPRFTPHGFQNDTNEEVNITLMFNPSQKREGFFRGLNETLSDQPIDPEKYLKLYNKYDSFPVDTANMLPIRNK
ncbi:cupin domain-containing protein [Aquimarina algiphila]|uniref:Cupin domain-containing protein n=1 Tax=Aquimarina algiphila TaxID=2047982 RepID=A0A554VDR4_9FLAO|nr:cupin domain-containing protein [Aquimarina algiphila]TSE05050.1 cupin domain-containing protein [Aquimarina algiphila]